MSREKPTSDNQFLPSLSVALGAGQITGKRRPGCQASSSTSDNVSDVRSEGVCSAVNFPVAALCDGGLFPSFCYDQACNYGEPFREPVRGCESLAIWIETKAEADELWSGLCDSCLWSDDHHAPGCPESEVL